jgi:hypothetical protein
VLGGQQVPDRERAWIGPVIAVSGTLAWVVATPVIRFGGWACRRSPVVVVVSGWQVSLRCTL